ncbi:MAG: MFS transporter [Candidatus Lokiarchaeota archaeon]|nr:MFS transporter [Candidatus Lokiarchaeota archaeon]
MQFKTNNNSLTYRSWPIFCLAFIRLFYVSIFERALYNYLYWNVGISLDILGFISSAGSIAYIVAPILGQFITSKIGIRNALIFTSIITPILTGLQVIYTEAWFLILCRISLGLVMGLYWPNCLNLLSRWQKISPREIAKRNFRNFNFSWNSGFIIGLAFGFVWTFLLNDYISLILSWGLSFLLIPISFFINKDSVIQIPKEEIQIHLENPIIEEDFKMIAKRNSTPTMMSFPIVFSWIGIIFLSTSKSILLFTYPVFVKLNSLDSQSTYLVQGGLQLAQLFGLTWVNGMNVYKRKISSFIGVIVLIFIAVTIFFIGNIWYIAIIFSFSGLFLGLIHGTSMKIMLDYGATRNTGRYSTINEIVIGIGFGVTPIIAGFIAIVNLYIIFVYIVATGIVFLIILTYLSRNIKRSKRNSE